MLTLTQICQGSEVKMCEKCEMQGLKGQSSRPEGLRARRWGSCGEAASSELPSPPARVWRSNVSSPAGSRQSTGKF